MFMSILLHTPYSLLKHFNGPQTKFIVDRLYKHPVHCTLSWSRNANAIMQAKMRKTLSTIGIGHCTTSVQDFITLHYNQRMTTCI